PGAARRAAASLWARARRAAAHARRYPPADRPSQRRELRRAVAMVPLAFALALAFAPPTSSPTPAPSTLGLQGQPRAPLVVLEPKLRRSNNPTARRLALGPKAIT